MIVADRGLYVHDSVKPQNSIKELYVPSQGRIPKKEKIKRIYEDDDFVIDLFPEEPTVRVSIFKDGHFQDEAFVRKDDYCG